MRSVSGSDWDRTFDDPAMVVHDDAIALEGCVHGEWMTCVNSVEVEQ